MTTQTNEIKKGQRVYIKGHSFDWSLSLEPATIVKRQPVVTSIPNDEWYVVRFNDGGAMSVHRSNMTLGNQ